MPGARAHENARALGALAVRIALVPTARARARVRVAASAPDAPKECALDATLVSGALLQLLYASCMACAAAVLALADAPHLSVEVRVVHLAAAHRSH
jgi:hypothetical protein